MCASPAFTKSCSVFSALCVSKFFSLHCIITAQDCSAIWRSTSETTPGCESCFVFDFDNFYLHVRCGVMAMGLMGNLAAANMGGRLASIFPGLTITSRDLSQRVKSLMVLVNNSSRRSQWRPSTQKCWTAMKYRLACQFSKLERIQTL